MNSIFSPIRLFPHAFFIFFFATFLTLPFPWPVLAQNLERSTEQRKTNFFLTNDLDLAAKTLHAATNVWPEYADTDGHLSESLAYFGDVDGALTAWHHTQQLHPSAAPNHYSLSALVSYNYGVTLFKKGELDRALTEWQLALRLQPAFPEVHYGIGLAQLVRRDFPRAIASFQQSLAYAPSWAQAQYQLGMAFFLNHSLPQSIEAWKQALTLKPHYAEAQSNIGLAHLKNGDAHRALGHFDEALTIDPTLPQAHFNRGLALAHLAHWRQALSSFQETLRLQPTFVPALYALGLSFHTIGRPGQAQEVWREGLRLRPPAHQAALIHAQLGDLSWQNGQASQALREYRHSLRLQPNQAPVHFRMGAIYMVLRNWSEANLSLNQAHHLEPTWPQPLINLGEVLYHQGNNKEAVQMYEQALAFTPDNADLHMKLGMTLRALNQPNQAFSHLHYAAQAGLADAQDLLGSMYVTGSGVSRNLPLAIQWWGRAATSSDSEARAHAREELSQLRSLVFLQSTHTSLSQEILEGFALIQREIRASYGEPEEWEEDMSVGKLLVERGDMRKGLQVLLQEAYALHPQAHHVLENLFPLVDTRKWDQEKHQLLTYFRETAQEGNETSCRFLQNQSSSATESSDSAHLVRHTGYPCPY